jgi:hypothetical protein
MRTITGSFKQAETFPLPCWQDDNKVLQYDSDWADELVCRSYGDEQDKYEVHPSTLVLYYKVSEKLRFRVAQITFESYFTDIKGQDWEKEWLETWDDICAEEGKGHSPENYEMYNMTLYHYNHPSLKSKLLDKNNRLKGFNSNEYIKDIMEKIERGERDAPGSDENLDKFWEDDDEDDDGYYK